MKIDGPVPQESVDYTDKQQLESLYYEQRYSMPEIAEMADTGASTIRYWMDKFGLERRGIGDAQRVEYAGYSMSGNGYMNWSCNWFEDQKSVKVHRLLAVSVYGFEAVDGKHVHHKNGLSWDNRPDNIELKSPREHHSGHSKGENHAATDLSEDDVINILELIESGDITQSEIADRYGITDGAVSNIKHGTTWGHLQRD